MVSSYLLVSPRRTTRHLVPRAVAGDPDGRASSGVVFVVRSGPHRDGVLANVDFFCSVGAAALCKFQTALLLQTSELDRHLISFLIHCERMARGSVFTFAPLVLAPL